jgi:hypothetical protein
MLVKKKNCHVCEENMGIPDFTPGMFLQSVGVCSNNMTVQHVSSIYLCVIQRSYFLRVTFGLGNLTKPH